MMELDPKAETQTEDANYKRVIEILSKLEKKSRPRKRKTLSQQILNIFQNKIEQREVERIVDTLFAKKMVSETNGVIAYEF